MKIDYDFDDLRTMLAKLSERNPEALSICKLIFYESAKIDPAPDARGLGYLFMLDMNGIYGNDLCVLFNDICNCNLAHLLIVLRARQFDLLTREQLTAAIRKRELEIHIVALLEKVLERVPGFKVQPESEFTR